MIILEYYMLRYLDNPVLAYKMTDLKLSSWER